MSSKKIIAISFLCAAFGFVAFAPNGSAAQTKKPAAGDASRGKELFSTCGQCHSATTKDAGVGPGLKGLFKGKKMPATNRPVSTAVVTSQIKKGGNGMPGFASKYSAQDISDLVAYLKTL
jgi:mono/diheme cytochrome c family protein